MKLLEHVPLAPFTTFCIGGNARYFVEAGDETDIWEAVRWADDAAVPLFVLGGGSNLLVPDEGFSGLVLRINLRGIAQHDCEFEVGAGEPWDPFVDTVIAADCAGLECLAGIPGSIGGTPVQNVGAYGQEVSETIASVRALDRRTGSFSELSNAQCGFRYRESIFNTSERRRYVITQVRFSFRAHGTPTLRYADLQKHFASQPAPSLSDVASAVREIRRAKGMVVIEGDPDTRSAGSFFKNPVVGSADLLRIAQAAGVSEESVPHWQAGAHHTKLAAAWLLEKAGFVKGYGDGPVRISSRHTLALTNRGDAAFADLIALQEEIVNGVRKKFGVHLEREPVLLA